MSLLEAHCIIVSPTWPGQPTGSGFASAGLLRGALTSFRSIDFVGVLATEWDGHLQSYKSHPVAFHRVQCDDSPKWSRFLRSLTSPWPGAVQRYAVAELRSLVAGLVEAAKESGQEVVLMFEDVPLGHLMLTGDAMVGQAALRVVRSENILADMFEGLAGSVSRFAGACWKFEGRRLEKFERRVLNAADVIWAITDEQKTNYERRYGIAVDGVAGVNVDTVGLAEVDRGDIQQVLYLGSFDLRKRSGIESFLSECWPALLSKNPDARLILGGAGSEAYDGIAEGVEGVGFVDDEIEFLSRGAVFVNPQQSGSGVKLKSLTAMAAGKILVSTRIGVEGIAVESGRHFLESDSIEGMAQRILEIWENPSRAETLAENARSFVAEHHSESGVDKELLALMSRL